MFWKDAWIEPWPLCNNVQLEPSVAQLNDRVVDIWDIDRVWIWIKLDQGLSVPTMLCLSPTVINPTLQDKDKLGWMSEKGDKFIVKSTYLFSNDWDNENAWMGWNCVWKAKVHPRVKTFCWILAHERILSNHKRWRRNMADNPGCVRCDERREDALHEIRDCKCAKDLWVLLLPSDIMTWFFSLDVCNWLERIFNLRSSAGDEL